MRRILVLILYLITIAPSYSANAYDNSGNLVSTGGTSSSCMQTDPSLVVTFPGTTCGTGIGASTYKNGSLLVGSHLELFDNVLLANNTTHVYAFGSTYAAIPVCTVSLNNSGNGNYWVSAVTISAVTIDNASGNTRTPYVKCAGF